MVTSWRPLSVWQATRQETRVELMVSCSQLIESSNVSAGARRAGGFSYEKSQFLHWYFNMRSLFMRSYTEVTLGITWNWVELFRR